MWIKTRDNVFYNTDHASAILYSTKSKSTQLYVNSNIINIANYDCTEQIMTGIQRGSNYMEV